MIFWIIFDSEVEISLNTKHSIFMFVKSYNMHCICSWWSTCWEIPSGIVEHFRFIHMFSHITEGSNKFLTAINQCALKLFKGNLELEISGEMEFYTTTWRWSCGFTSACRRWQHEIVDWIFTLGEWNTIWWYWLNCFRLNDLNHILKCI